MPNRTLAPNIEHHDFEFTHLLFYPAEQGHHSPRNEHLPRTRAPVLPRRGFRTQGPPTAPDGERGGRYTPRALRRQMPWQSLLPGHHPRRLRGKLRVSVDLTSALRPVSEQWAQYTSTKLHRGHEQALEFRDCARPREAAGRLGRPDVALTAPSRAAKNRHEARSGCTDASRRAARRQARPDAAAASRGRGALSGLRRPCHAAGTRACASSSRSANYPMNASRS